jgi:hypothetical protein
MRLRIPATLVVTLLGVTSCGDDDGPPADAEAHVFCAMDPADAGPPPAPDANPCGQLVVSPDDCPEGCIPFA